jgi:hypothetical protein
MAPALSQEAWLAIGGIIAWFVMMSLEVLVRELSYESRLARLRIDSQVLRQRQLERLIAMRGEAMRPTPRPHAGVEGDFELVEETRRTARAA